MADVPGIAGYAEEAPNLERYERYAFEWIHNAVLHLLPPPPAAVLDIGAGTGRDAAALSRMGHRVTAVEPVAEMREPAMRRHADCAIEWIDDGLPELASLIGSEGEFDLVMLTAVFMHLDAKQRARSLETVADLVKPGGLVRMSLRHGPVPQGRTMFEVSSAEVSTAAAPLGFETTLDRPHSYATPGKPEVTWSHIVLTKINSAAQA